MRNRGTETTGQKRAIPRGLITTDFRDGTDKNIAIRDPLTSTHGRNLPEIPRFGRIAVRRRNLFQEIKGRSDAGRSRFYLTLWKKRARWWHEPETGGGVGEIGTAPFESGKDRMRNQGCHFSRTLSLSGEMAKR